MKNYKAIFKRVGKEMRLTVFSGTEIKTVYFKHTLPYFKVGDFKIGFIEFFHENRTDLIDKIIIKSVNNNLLSVEIYRDNKLLDKLGIENDLELFKYPTVLKIRKV